MLHSIYIFTKTEVSYPFNETSTEISSRVYIDRVDAQEEMKRDILSELEGYAGFDKEKAEAYLKEDPDNYSFEVDRGIKVYFQVQKSGMFQDQVEKLNDQNEYMKKYEKYIEAQHQDGLA